MESFKKWLQDATVFIAIIFLLFVAFVCLGEASYQITGVTAQKELVAKTRKTPQQYHDDYISICLEAGESNPQCELRYFELTQILKSLI